MSIKLSKSLQPQLRYEQICAKAYEIWLAKGKLSGEDITNWLQAEKEITTQENCSANLSKPVSKFIHQRILRLIGWDIPRWFIFTLPTLEWLKLLAVPLLLTVGGSIITGQLQKESNQSEALNKYFDQLEKLTFEHKLLEGKPNSAVVLIARARTLTALRTLDQARKQQLIGFLQDSGLLGSRLAAEKTKESIISFEDTDLTNINLKDADLRSANFKGANLSGANLSFARFSIQTGKTQLLPESERGIARVDYFEGADFTLATLNGTNFSKAKLSHAKFTTADLEHTNFNNAELDYADFTAASFSFTNFSSANLSGANFANTNISSVNLNGANLSFAQLSYTTSSESQLRTAKLCLTKLQKGMKVDPNRDCKELNIDSTKYRDMETQSKL